MRKLTLLVLSAAALAPAGARAGFVLPAEPGGDPTRPLAVRHETIAVEVDDQIARATVDEVFENTTDKALEGRYLLPLPDGAAVSGFAQWIEGRKVESRMEEKQQANARYEQAKREGAHAAMIQKLAPGTFEAKVDRIGAHETRRVEASWAQVLPYDSGVVTLRVPMSVKGVDGAEPVGDLTIALRVRDQKKITQVEVDGVPALAVKENDHAWKLLVRREKALPDRDLVVRYHTESTALGLAFTAYRPDPKQDGYFLLTIAPQELTTASDIVAKAVVFVFDQSGSMQGPKIEQARQALKRCLSSLNRTDEFGIVAFSDGLDPYRGKLAPASEENVKDALAFADGLVAGGGTNISGALASGLALVRQSDKPRVIVFMTDGEPTAGVTDPGLLAEQVKQSSEGTRIFPFGVGGDVNRLLLERLARENRGAVGFVDEGAQQIDDVVAGFYAKIARPVLADLAFAWGDATTLMTYPDVLPDLYKGSQLVLVGRYRDGGAGPCPATGRSAAEACDTTAHAKLTGQLNGAKKEYAFTAVFPKERTEDSFVERLWAQRRIDYLLAQMRLHGEQPEMKDEVVALSKRHGILTPYTAMITRPTLPMVASLTPSRVKPGDPLVVVPAPRDSRRVRVRLPFGDDVDARWDARRGAFTARFLVPPGAPDGVYPVEVTIWPRRGHSTRLALTYTVDTQGPALAVKAEPAAILAGTMLRLSARPRVGVIAASKAAIAAPLGAKLGAVKALADVKRVTAALWDGTEIPLALDRTGGWSATVETPMGLEPGTYPISIVAVDWAGNVDREVVDVAVSRPTITLGSR